MSFLTGSFTGNGDELINVFSSLELSQLLNNQPRLVSGTMMNQKAHHVEHGFHGQ